MDPLLLNITLSLALEWGKDWLQPTQGRMRAKYPDLSDADLDACDAAARAAMKAGFDFVYQSPNCSREQVRDAVRKEHAWVSDDNLGRIHSQGCYYAMK